MTKRLEDKQRSENKFITVTETDQKVTNMTIQRRILDSGEEDIVMRGYETTTTTRRYTLHFYGVLFLVLMVGVLVLGVLHWRKNFIAQETMAEKESASIIDENGFVFADSNRRYLTREEIEALQNNEEYSYRDLLRYAVNEIYARHGYVFEAGGSNETYYNRFSWYRELSKQNVSYSMLNKYEQKNIDLLVEVEKENGFR